MSCLLFLTLFALCTVLNSLVVLFFFLLVLIFQLLELSFKLPVAAFQVGYLSLQRLDMTSLLKWGTFVCLEYLYFRIGLFQCWLDPQRRLNFERVNVFFSRVLFANWKFRFDLRYRFTFDFFILLQWVFRVKRFYHLVFSVKTRFIDRCRVEFERFWQDRWFSRFSDLIIRFWISYRQPTWFTFWVHYTSSWAHCTQVI